MCFDVDSTVCTDEGIDELAAFLGKGDEVAEMTNKAMGGNVSFRDALESRLRVMQPTRQTVETYLANNEPKISPGVAELFDALRANGKTVYLVSGGFRQMIAPVAERLGVPTKTSSPITSCSTKPASTSPSTRRSSRAKRAVRLRL